jgi:hypothetical protein
METVVGRRGIAVGRMETVVGRRGIVVGRAVSDFPCNRLLASRRETWERGGRALKTLVSSEMNARPQERDPVPTRASRA